jgi:hypothetical protein
MTVFSCFATSGWFQLENFRLNTFHHYSIKTVPIRMPIRYMSCQ